MKLGVQVGLGSGHIVLHGKPGSPPAKEPSNFRSISVVAKWLDGSRCHLVGRYRHRPSNILLDGDPALSSQKGGGAPQVFGPYPLCPNGCMDQDATWHGGRPRPRSHCARWGLSSPAKGAQPPLFDPCLLWPNGRPSQLLLSTCTNGRPKTAENKWCDAT